MNTSPSPLLNGPCLNCGEILTGPYCRACGQKADTRRVTLHGLLHEIPHAILHLDRGFFATLRALSHHPGEVINGWLDGQRIRWFNPFTLLVVLAGLGALLYGNYPFRFHAPPGTMSPAELQAYARFAQFGMRYFTLLMLLVLPLFALLSWLCFVGSSAGRSRSYVEHLVINAFIVGFVLFLAVCLFPIMALTNQYDFFPTVYLIGMATYFLYEVSAFYAVFARPGRRLGAALRATLAITLNFAVIGILPVLIFFKVYLGR